MTRPVPPLKILPKRGASPIWRQVEVSVSLPKFIVGISEHVEEVAVSPSWTLLYFKQATDRHLPPRHRAKFTLKLPACVPSSIEQRKGCLTFLFRLVLNIYIAPQMRFQVAADLELNHSAHILEFREHIIIEVKELLVGFFLTVLEACIGVVVVPSALLHSKCCKHAFDQKGGARCWEIMLT